MKLIVGLGNPGEKYTKTRHNVGFMFTQYFSKKNDFSDWKYESKFKADISEGTVDSEKILLVKPQTFMNLSGESLQKICQFYRLGASDFTVIYDDKDMDFGKVRVRETGSAGGHNGVKDVIKYFGNDWKRIKIGVGKNSNYDTADWVLSNFTEEELIDLGNEVFEKVEQELTRNTLNNPPHSSFHTKGGSNTSSLPLKKSEEQKTEMCMKNKVYLIGIGGIGVSAIARYYLSEGWEVLGSDKTDSELIHALQSEGCNIIIGTDDSRISKDIHLVVYTEAIPKTQKELQKAQELGVETQKYNVALSKIANHRKMIAVTGTHGKSTTTSLISILLKDAQKNFLSVVGTILKEFDGKNFYRHTPGTTSLEEYFIIEACEYKEHFLEYTPSVLVITNIEYDHADYFINPAHYLQAFEKFIGNVVTGGFVILDGREENSKKLIGARDDVYFIEVFDEYFALHSPVTFGLDPKVQSHNSSSSSRSHDQAKSQLFDFPKIELQVPGSHVLYDAKLAYIVAHMAGITDTEIQKSLSNYTGVWRRMEIIGKTENGNILMSDYGHHPTEIEVTLRALRQGYPDKKILTIFQPHQYSRTLELLNGFQNCFGDTDTLIIPDIYESRDSEENKKKINTEKLVSYIHHPNVHNGDGLENTLKIIEEYDAKNPNSGIILLQGAGDVDNLRYKIKTS